MVHWREFLDAGAGAGRYLPWKEVARRTSLSRTTAWRLQRRDEFPRPYPISPGRVGHLECEVEAWIASRATRPVAASASGSRSPEPGSWRRPERTEDSMGAIPQPGQEALRKAQVPGAAPRSAADPPLTPQPGARRPRRAQPSGDAASRQLSLDL